MEMGRRYVVLRTFSAVLRIMGWIAVVLGLIIIAVGLFDALEPSAHMMGAMMGWRVSGGGVGIVVTGLLLVLYGELLEVFADIEVNTRHTAELIEHLAAAVRRPAP